MNNLIEEKELLKNIYIEIEETEAFTEERKEELIQIINSLENKFNSDTVKKNILIELKDRLENIKVNESEKNVKKTILDLTKGVIQGLIELLISYPGI